MAFIITREATVATDPCQAALDYPPLRQNHEAVPVAAAHDLECPAAGSGDAGRHFRALVTGIADDALDEREQSSGSPQQFRRAVAVLDVGRVHNHPKQQAERVGQDVTLAADQLFARIIPGRIERSAPFCAPFAVWLSMIAVLGLASRPACSRTATYST